MSPCGDIAAKGARNTMIWIALKMIVRRTLIVAAGALWLCLPVCLPAQNLEGPNLRTWKIGSEIDLLPYALKGYYGSLVAGQNYWRVRAIATRAPEPSFLVTSGFKEKRSDAYALIGDYFLGSKKEQQEGFWAGGGAEYWHSRIRAEASSTFAHYDNVMLTAGGGYVWKLSQHCYLNPWSGGHFVVAGKRDIDVSGVIYKQPVFTPEASVKVGIRF